MDFKAAQNYWVVKDKEGKKMPENDLLAAIVDYVVFPAQSSFSRKCPQRL